MQRRETFDKAVKGQEHIAREGLGLRAIAQGFALPGISDEERLPRNTHSTTRCMNTFVRSRTSGSKTIIISGFSNSNTRRLVTCLV